MTKVRVLKDRQNIYEIEIHHTDCLDLVSSEFAHRHGKRNALSDHAALFKEYWVFNRADRNT